MGAYGGLFTSPFAALLIPLELAHQQTPGFYGTLTIAAIAGVLGFSVFFAVGGEAFASVLRILDLLTYSLRLWHLILAIALGILGAVLGLIFGLLLRVLKRLTIPVNGRLIIRGTASGFLLGLLGMALPLTLFLGTSGLEVVTEQGTQMGLALVIVMVFAKMLATTGALANGFIGGPIFPLLFVSGTAGTAVNLIFPEIPLALAVACMMAGSPACPAPITARSKSAIISIRSPSQGFTLFRDTMMVSIRTENAAVTG
jgi:H+/Cl- antiporter ClcA